MKSTKNILVVGVILAIVLCASIQISAMRINTQKIMSQIDYYNNLVSRYNDAIKMQKQILDPKNKDLSLEEKIEAQEYLDDLQYNLEITKNYIEKLNQQLLQKSPQ